MSSDDELGENELCPICADELDLTDLSFHPCACGFQVTDCCSV